MATIPTSNISLQAIQAETGYSATTNISLQAQSANAANTGHTSTRSGYTSPGGGLTGAPYGMGEFAGYVNLLQTAANVQDGVASFSDIVIQPNNNFVISFGQWQLVNQSQITGSNYRHQWYIEEVNSGFPGSYTPTSGSNTAMSTGTLYAWHHIDFTTSNWPDSYYVDVSTSKVQFGAAQTVFTDIAGVGETYSSGSSWDGAVKTIINPTQSSGRTSYGFQHQASTECNDFDVTWTVNVKIYYKKTGYPDLLAVDRNVTVSQEGYWTASLCQ